LAVVTTALFTDIEGSTRLWEQHPEARQDALARHDALLSEGCPHLRILAGSPEALRIVGEQTYRVPSLSVPDPQRLPPLERPLHHPASQGLRQGTLPCTLYGVVKEQLPVFAPPGRNLDQSRSLFLDASLADKTRRLGQEAGGSCLLEREPGGCSIVLLTFWP
jgi:hypothetical protein